MSQIELRSPQSKKINTSKNTLFLVYIGYTPSEALEPNWFIAAGAYPGFCSMKRLEVFLLPLDGMLVHRRSLPRNLLGFPQQFAGTQLYTWVERGTVRVKCLAQEHNIVSPARLEPGLLALESSALTMRPPRLRIPLDNSLISSSGYGEF